MRFVAATATRVRSLVSCPRCNSRDKRMKHNSTGSGLEGRPAAPHVWWYKTEHTQSISVHMLMRPGDTFLRHSIGGGKQTGTRRHT
jgi:hypothetical protein